MREPPFPGQHIAKAAGVPPATVSRILKRAASHAPPAGLLGAPARWLPPVTRRGSGRARDLRRDRRPLASLETISGAGIERASAVLEHLRKPGSWANGR